MKNSFYLNEKNKKNILNVFLFFAFCLPLNAQDSSLEHNNLGSVENHEASREEHPGANIINPNEPTILKGHVSKIPSGTKLKIILETPIDEETSMISDEITARTSKDVVIDDIVAVSAGSTVIGEISEINPARRLHMAGSVRIEFKSLTVPDGRQIPIVASVLSRSGLIKGKYTKKTALISGATVVAPVAAGFGAGLAAEGSPLGGTIGAALGAVVGIALFAFQRGNMVDIKAGDELNIELVEEALVPKPEYEKVIESDVTGEQKSSETKLPDTKSIQVDFTEQETLETPSQEVKPFESPVDILKDLERERGF